jgi:hypothetical protein
MKVRIELDNLICIGDVMVAAVVKRWVHCHNGSHILSIHGAKQPVAVLIHHHEVTMAFEIDGTRIDRDEFEQRFPGQCATFERFVNAGD